MFKSGFGQQQGNQASPFGFGQTQQPAQTSLFGAPAQSSMFGAAGSTNTTTQPAASPFGAPAAASPFGAPVGNTLGGGNAMGLGGQPGATGQKGTTHTPYSVREEKEKDARTSQFKTERFQAITMMPQYANHTFQELRAQDYQNNVKGPSAVPTNTGFGFGAPQPQPSAGLFGSTNTPSLFGGTSAFGQNTVNSPFGAGGSTGNTSGGMFGQNSNTNTGSTSAFGGSNAFGAAPSTSSTGFGFGTSNPSNNTSGGLFGQNNNNNAASPFGVKPAAPASTGLFGQSNSTNNTMGGASGFGFGNTQTNTTNNSPFGTTTNTSGSGLFGQNNNNSGTSAFGQNKPSLFGNANTTPTGMFGQNSQQPAATGGGFFGQQNNGQQPSTGFGFGSTTNTANNSTGGGLFGSGFGQNNQSTNAFGRTNTTGTSAFGQSQPAQSGFGFGNTQQNKPATGGLFGQPQNNNAFGQPTNTAATSGGLFGSKPATAGGTGLFGTTNTQQPGSTGFGFGANNNNNQSSGAFGQAKPAVGFGQTNTNSGGLFGTTNTNQTGNTGGGLFGNNNSSNNTGGGLFGNANNNTNQGSTGFGSTGAGGLFGNNNNNNNQATGTGTGGGFGSNLFGNNNANTNTSGGNTVGGLFGNKPATGGGLFGNTGANNTQNTTGGSLFGNTGNTGTSATGGFGAATNTQNTAGAFGSNTSGGGLFGNKPATGGLFGSNTNKPANTQQTGSSLFGANAPSSGASMQNTSANNGSLFGNSAQVSTGPVASIDSNAYLSNPLFSNIRQSSGVVDNQQPTATSKRESSNFKAPAGVLLAQIMQPRPLPKGQRLKETPVIAQSESASVEGKSNIDKAVVITGNSNASLVKFKNAIYSNATDDIILNTEAFDFAGRNAKRIAGVPESVGIRAVSGSTPSKGKNKSRESQVEDEEFEIISPSITNVSAEGIEMDENVESVAVRRTVDGSDNDAVANERSESGDSESGNVGTGEDSYAADVPDNEAVDSNGYWISPASRKIMNMTVRETRGVKNFRVGQRTQGFVEFLEPVDLSRFSDVRSQVAGRIVAFSDRSFCLYPIESERPPVGQGFNVKHRVTLYNIFAHSRETLEPIKDPEHPIAKKFLKKLKAQNDFISWSAQTGTWSFEVDPAKCQ